MGAAGSYASNPLCSKSTPLALVDTGPKSQHRRNTQNEQILNTIDDIVSL